VHLAIFTVRGNRRNEEDQRDILGSEPGQDR